MVLEVGVEWETEGGLGRESGGDLASEKDTEVLTSGSEQKSPVFMYVEQQ